MNQGFGEQTLGLEAKGQCAFSKVNAHQASSSAFASLLSI